jgi:hypothetical protein
MATTKKKLPVAAMTAKKKTITEKVIYPIVTKGSHLTVTEYEDGRTELVWDDEALVNDVRKALVSVK